MNKVIIAIIVIAIGALAGWFAFGGSGGLPNLSLPTAQKPVPTPVPTNEPSGLYTYTETSVTPGAQPTSAATKGGQPTGQAVSTKSVTYTDQGFQPATITVKVNTAVTFTNQSGSTMHVRAAAQPIPQEISGFDGQKSVAKGGIYTYTFKTVGTWKYLNQDAPTRTGIVIVTQ